MKNITAASAGIRNGRATGVLCETQTVLLAGRNRSSRYKQPHMMGRCSNRLAKSKSSDTPPVRLEICKNAQHPSKLMLAAAANGAYPFSRMLSLHPRVISSKQAAAHRKRSSGSRANSNWKNTTYPHTVSVDETAEERISEKLRA